MASLSHISYAALAAQYYERLSPQLVEGDDAVVVPIFRYSLMKGDHGASAEIMLPNKLWKNGKMQFKKLDLDFKLGCPGWMDANCPQVRKKERKGR